MTRTRLWLALALLIVVPAAFAQGKKNDNTGNTRSVQGAVTTADDAPANGADALPEHRAGYLRKWKLPAARRRFQPQRADPVHQRPGHQCQMPGIAGPNHSGLLAFADGVFEQSERPLAGALARIVLAGVR